MVPDVTQKKAESIRKEIVAALEEIAKRHGLRLGKAKATYNDTQIQLKVSIEAVDENGLSLNSWVTWQNNCETFGFKSTDFGREIKHNGTTYQIIGIQPSRKRTPIIGKEKIGGTIVGIPLEIAHSAIVREDGE